MPGKEYNFFYRCIDEEGKEFIKKLPFRYRGTKAAGIPDDRSFGERHPNIHAVGVTSNLVMTPLSLMLVGLLQ